MKFQAHRGVVTEFPENTMPAFIAAAAQGYSYIEADPAMTADGVCVLFHDNTLNRTCRKPNGEPLEKDILLSDITYREALNYDAGLFKAPKFKGTEIPTLEYLLRFAKEADIAVKLDNRIEKFSEKDLETVFHTVEQYGGRVGFTGATIDYLKRVAKRFPNAEIHYDGPVYPETLETLKTTFKGRALTVWLSLPSELTSWVKVPRADEALCAAIKSFANLGLWILETEEQLKKAEEFGADVIETTGSLKPMETGLFAADCHSHTWFSHDSDCNPEESFSAAKEKGLYAFTVTDHCDLEFPELFSPLNIKSSAHAAKRLNDRADKVKVFSGIEIGAGNREPGLESIAVGLCHFDAVIASLHSVNYPGYCQPYSGVDFSKFNDQMIHDYLKAYFNELLLIAKTCNYDILAHLTCPLRYISGKYGIKAELSTFKETIDEILKTVIQSGATLEVNTSCLGSAYDELMPNRDILKRYRDLGGRMLTLGADAHVANRLAHGFENTKKVLKSLGFTHLYYYKKRVGHPYSI